MATFGRIGIVLFAVLLAVFIKLVQHGRRAEGLATIALDRRFLTVRVSGITRVAGIIGTIEVPLASIVGVRIERKAKKALRGVRIGTYLPRALAAGRWRSDGRYQYVAATPSRPALVVELDGDHEPWSGIVVRTSDVEADLERLDAAARRSA